MRRILSVLAAATLTLTLAATPLLVRAAAPTSGTISPTSPVVTWTGGPLTTDSDTFKLAIAIPETYYALHPRAGVRISVATTGEDDADVTVSWTTAPKWNRSSALREAGHDQVTLLTPKSGAYDVVVEPFGANQNAYTAKAMLVPALADTARPASPIRFQKNTIVDPTTDKEASKNTGEPSLAVDSKGRIYVVAPGAGVHLWRSENGGTSFTHMGDFDSDFMLGGGDSEIEIDRNDNIYIADLAVVSINILKSTDHAKTFPQRAITGYESDRQWIASYGEKTVYLGYHDIGFENEIVFRSDDGGATFTQATLVHELTKTQEYVDCFENTFSGPVAVDQKDETIYIVYACGTAQTNVTSDGRPWGPANSIYVAVSHDRGATFTNHKAMAFPVGANAGNLFPAMALDRAGNVYVTAAKADVEGGRADVMLSVSKDKGETWSAPMVVNKTRGTHVFPWVAAGDAGRINIAFASSSATSPNDLDGIWNIEMVQSLNALDAKPAFTQTRVSEKPIHIGQVCTAGIACAVGGDRSLLDFIEVQLDPQGLANVAWTENANGARHVAFSRQVAGPSLYATKVQGTRRTQQQQGSVTDKRTGRLPATGVEDAATLALLLVVAAALLARRVRAARR